MAKPTTFHSEIKLRIKKVKTIELIEKIYNEGSKRYSSINDILNDALEIGLPCIWQNNLPPKSVEDIIKNGTQRVIMNQNRCTSKMMIQLKKITMLQSVQELMISSLIQEFEQFLKIQGIELDEELLEEFKHALPKRFEEDKEFFISQLLIEEDKSDE